MPEMAKLITLVKQAGFFRLEIDGEEFPWHVAPGVDVHLDRGSAPGVRLTIIAERVQVVDALTQASLQEAADA